MPTGILTGRGRGTQGAPTGRTCEWAVRHATMQVAASNGERPAPGRASEWPTAASGARVGAAAARASTAKQALAVKAGSRRVDRASEHTRFFAAAAMTRPQLRPLLTSICLHNDQL